jgi:diadenosine tetraphosphate (Ap4A) HIT family hydrolase
MEFTLHSNLAKKDFVADLPLCRVLMEDEKHYPWLFLVPRRPGISRIMDLSPKDQLLLLQELDLAQKILWDAFKPTQINVAALGNKTPQLHVHVIARYDHDPAWPKTVWDHPARSRYDAESKNSRILQLRELLGLGFKEKPDPAFCFVDENL